MNKVWVVVIVLVVLAVVASGAWFSQNKWPGRACTEIACFDQVSIEVTNADFPLRGTLGGKAFDQCGTGSQEVYVFAREGQGRISAGTGLFSSIGTFITLSIEKLDTCESKNVISRVSQDVALTKEILQPNGPGCDPICESWKGSITIP